MNDYNNQKEVARLKKRVAAIEQYIVEKELEEMQDDN